MQQSLEAWQAIARECQRRDFQRVLIEEDIASQITAIEMFTVVSALPSMGFARIKLAFVDRHLSQQDLNAFGETVAVNRGMNAKIFASVEEAEEWLLTP